MKKKFLLFVLSSAMLVGCAGLLASCGHGENDHTYEQTASTEATCTQAGSITYTCTGCDSSYTETVKALGHDYQSSVSADGTKKVYTCSRCGDSYSEDISSPVEEGSDITVTAGKAVLTYSAKDGSVETKVDGSAVNLGTASSVTNNDASGEWWTGGTDTVSLTGDFVVQYTWTNTRDTSYTDAVVELTDGTKYWDNTVFADLWGDLYTEATVTSSKFYLNGKETTSTALGTEGFFGGEYTATVVRNGSDIIVCVNVTKTDGDRYAQIITQSGFTTADLTVGLTGNPYWIDDIKVAHTGESKTDPEPQPDPTPVEGSDLEFVANSATLNYYKDGGKVSVTIDGEKVTLSEPSEVTNNDAGTAWWDGATESLPLSGDFVVQYTWTNTRDTSYTDAVVELTDGTKYWDNTTFADLWGDLYTGATTTSSKFYLNGAETTSTAVGTAGFFAGDYTVTIVRSGDKLIVCENLTRTNGDQYAFIITQSGFSTADMSACLTGNPYWIDNIKMAFFMPAGNMAKITVNYVNEQGEKVADSAVKYVAFDAAYTVTSPEILGYKATQATVTGTATADAVIDVVCSPVNVYNYTVNYVYEDGTSAGESISMQVNEGGTVTFSAPFITSYMPEREYYRMENVTKDTVYNVVYSYQWHNHPAYITYDKITGANEMTLPEGVNAQTGVTFTFLLSGCTDDWAYLISSQGYNITYGCLDSWDRNAHKIYPSLSSFGGDNATALKTTEEIFVAVTIRSNSISFYVNGEMVISYGEGDLLESEGYTYYADTWARNILNAIANKGFTFNAQTYNVHRLAISGAMSDNSVRTLYNAIKEAYASELVVKYVCPEEDNHLLGKYTWAGLATDYSITPPDILGYTPYDSSVRTGRAEGGRTTVIIYYQQKGIATLTLNYVDEDGNKLMDSVTKQVTIPIVTETAPEIAGYTPVNAVETRWTMKHGGSYEITFEYAPHTHEYEKGICTICGLACPHTYGADNTCSACGGVMKVVKQKISQTSPAAWTPFLGDQEITYGNMVLISGTQTSAMANNWETVLYEFTEGFTGRFDAWGWTFGDAKLGTGYTSTNSIEDAEGNAVTFATSDEFWAAFREIGKECDWLVYCEFSSKTELTVITSITATGGDYAWYSYTCTYTLPITDTTLTSVHVHMTTDGTVSSVTVTETATLTWPVKCDGHVWEEGVCTKCGTACSHEWEEATCTICGMVCTHEWDENGVCDVCGTECTHEWANGVCAICSMECQHDWEGDTCKACGMTCTHTWNNGTCASCGTVCQHENETTICSTCGAVWTDTEKTISATTVVGPEWTTIMDDVTVAYGNAVEVKGTQISAMENNWSTVLYEFTEGFTGRFDAYGWTFGDAKLGAGYTTDTLIKDASDKALTFDTSDAFWTAFREIAKESDWAVKCIFDSKEEITVVVSVTATSGDYKGYTYICDYIIPLTDTSLTAVNIHFKDGGTALTVTVDRVSTWTWSEENDDAIRNALDAEAEAKAQAAYDEALAKCAAEKGLATLGAADCTTAFWRATQYVTPTYNDDGTFDMTITGYQFTDGAENYDTLLTVIYSNTNETEWTEEYVARMDNYGWGKATVTMESDWDWTTYLSDVNEAEVTINIKFDGTNVIVKYSVTPLLAGQEFTGTASGTLSDGSSYTASSFIEVPETVHTQTYTITVTNATNGVRPMFTIEKAYFIFTEVTGGTLA